MSESTVRLSSFRAGSDMETFAAAMEYMAANPGTTLIVEPGVYELTSALAVETMEHVMRGDYGSNPQRTMFSPDFEYTRGISFAGQLDSTVIAYGVTLMVEGFMEPVSVRDCRNVTIRGLTIDHKRKPYSRGIVKNIETGADGKRYGIIEFDAECPIQPSTPMCLRYIYFDTSAYKVIPCSFSPQFIDSHHVKTVLDNDKVTEGIEFYTVHTYHSRPAILIENAENITLEDITIHSQPGMGIVGNRGENVIIRHLNVVPSCGHHYSTNTDATHFTSMKGLLRLENCIFESQGDDFTNIHAYYQAVVGREDGNAYYLQEKTPDGTHAQSLDYPDVGDEMELTEHSTLKCLGTYKVLSCTPMPEKWMCRVVFDRALPEDTEGLMLSDITRLPQVEVVGCTARTHFARSVLVKTRSALIEGNSFFDVMGPAIVAAAEAWWYEGVCPANVIIRRNRIVNCSWSWGEAAGIVVKADADRAGGQSISNVLIEDNIIDSPRSAHGIFSRNVDGLTLRRNIIGVSAEPAVISDCTNVNSDLN